MGFILIICTIFILILWVNCIKEKEVKNKAKIVKLSISLLFFIIMTTYYFTPFCWKVPPDSNREISIEIFGSDRIELNENELNQSEFSNIIDVVNSITVQRVSVINDYGYSIFPRNQSIIISVFGLNTGYHSDIYLFNNFPKASSIDYNGKKYNIKNASEIIDKITKLNIPEKIPEN